ncbi:hypothetical protein [uncultured Flavobacterium sp.]|uniref:hypothetical protein n=1 Tax=uncultured Flavobacterium sp. TaxID=165435 RepID=UPI0025DB5F12|nr:hypothetical protein [uncultured Flavobacterium sp.]
MKSNLLKLYIFAFLFIGDYVMFAQGDESDDEGDPGCEGSLEGCDPPPASISPKLIWLAIVGISFAIYYFNRAKQAKAVSK